MRTDKQYFGFLTKPVAITLGCGTALIFCATGTLFGTFFGLSLDSLTPTPISREITQIVTQVAECDPCPQLPTYTTPPRIEPSRTATPSATQSLTSTPTVVLSPTPTPEPMVFSGEGDSVVDLNLSSPGVLHIVGNSDSRYFAVESLASTGESIDLLVSSTDPYDGRRPLDWLDNQNTVRLKITASGPWEITYYPLLVGYLHTLTVPGTYQGNGDDVIFLLGASPDVANVQGNSDGRYFSVTAYLKRATLLVTTTDPYKGTVVIPSDTTLLEIVADGAWSIEISEK